MRRFGTQGPVHPKKNYVVSRAAELADFIMRVKEGALHCYLRAAADRQNDLLPTCLRCIRGPRSRLTSQSR